VERNKPTILSSEKHQLLNEFFALYLKMIDQAKLQIADGELVKAEMRQSIVLVQLIQALNQAYNEQLMISERLDFVLWILEKQSLFIEEQKRLWLARNKSGGLQDSLAYLDKFFLFVLETKKYLQRGEANGA
jgi:hypothetical protein